MAIIRGVEERQKTEMLRPGDAVFDVGSESEPRWHVHVAIFAEEAERAYEGTQTRARVMGLPRGRARGDQSILGETLWGEPGNYKIDDVGQRRGVSALQVKYVLSLGQLMLAELPQLDERVCKWREKRRSHKNQKIAGEVPVLVEGNCAHFVEHLYVHAGLALVDERVTLSPEDRADSKHSDWLRPTAQLHAFWTGRYPLSRPWDDRLGRYPDCFFGDRSRDA